MLKTIKRLFLIAMAVCLGAPLAYAVEQPQEWEMVNPAGVFIKPSIAPAKRISTLDGKTIALRWNSKHNGDIVLNHLAELLAKKYPTAKILKTYEMDPTLNKLAGSNAESERIAKTIVGMKPDIVIASQCD